MKILKILFAILTPVLLSAQTDASLSRPNLLPILQGNYDPSVYAATQVIDDHAEIICELQDAISPDSLRHYLEVLGDFYTRHTWSDTVSNTRGIGAARRWIHSKFEEYSSNHENRLRPAYLSFDVNSNTCGTLVDTKNVIAVLPGSDTSQKEIIVIEAHMDSRCEDRCDTSCVAQGIDDNGSGTALVLELARVMSKFTFNRTILFMTTTGEEQGLLGADAMAQFAVDNNIAIRAVLNNDIVGGVICGITSSPPGCFPPGSVDSMNLRIYANPVSYLFPHQSFARSVKMFYEEKLKPISSVQMELSVMGQEDRTGRGGDHIPFRQRGFRNLRFTASNEHGNGAPNATYTDRQHTVDDILGLDTDGDMVIDSFFVDFNYLGRNSLVNGNAATLLAQGPAIPEFTLHNEPTGLRVEITNGPGAMEYRVGVRDGSQTDFDKVYSFMGTSFIIPDQLTGQFYYVSVSTIDSNGIMSPFSTEDRAFSQATTPTGPTATLNYTINCQPIGGRELAIPTPSSGLVLGTISPNPFKGQTTIKVQVNQTPVPKDATLIFSTDQGKRVREIPLELTLGENAVTFNYEGSAGFLICTLKQGERIISSKKVLAK